MANRYGTVSATEQARQANLKREQEIRGLLDKVIDVYSPGGEFGKATEAMLARQKQQYLGRATQGLISSGLYGSTLTAGMPKRFEEEIGMPTRAKLEDIRLGQYTSALGQKAGFVERIEDVGPDLGLLAQLQAQASAKPEPSLGEWLSSNFGSVPSAATPKADLYASQQRTAAAADAQRRAQALADLRKQYSTATARTTPPGSTTSAAKKQAEKVKKSMTQSMYTSFVPQLSDFGV